MGKIPWFPVDPVNSIEFDHILSTSLAKTHGFPWEMAGLHQKPWPFPRHHRRSAQPPDAFSGR